MYGRRDDMSLFLQGVDVTGATAGRVEHVEDDRRRLLPAAYRTAAPTYGKRRKWPVSSEAYPPAMPRSPLPDTVRAATSWAEVRANGRVIRYRRSGVGRAVLLLSPPDQSEPLWPELLDELAVSFRLITPEPPADEADVACWLGTFLEGLGVSNVGIVAAGCFCIPALELALSRGDQIARLVLVPDGRGSRLEGRGALEPATRHLSVGLLVVQRGQRATETVPLVTGFLSGDGNDIPA